MAPVMSPIVDAGRKREDLVHETVTSKMVMFFNHSLALDSGKGMLNFDSRGGYNFVFGLLICGKSLTLRLLYRLNDDPVARFIALKTGVLPQETGIWESILCFCDRLVIRLVRNGGSHKQDEACKGGNHRIFDCTLLLFPTVKLAWTFGSPGWGIFLSVVSWISLWRTSSPPLSSSTFLNWSGSIPTASTAPLSISVSV